MEQQNGQQGASGGIVLIVDDTETSAAALELACAGIPGIRVSTVSSALEAVRVLRDRSQAVYAVMTDIRMPTMNGFDLIRYIRADERLAKTPIIVVTADTDPHTPELAAILGANAFFSKPASPRAVRDTLERLLNEDPSAK